MEELKEITIYTDGACSGNPGAGGYGVILCHGERRKELSAGFRLTTNNRMEMIAAITGLKGLNQKCRVTLYTDSQYVAQSIMQGWAVRWRSNGWKRNKKEKAVNADLWAVLLDLCAQHEVRFEWVKGHAGHAENERCDQLAVSASQGKDLPADEGYDNQVLGRDPSLLRDCMKTIQDSSQPP